MFAPDEGLRNWLNRLLLRSSLESAACDAILSLPGELESVAPNRDFVRLGEHVDRACLIVSGLAGRFGQTKTGNRQITALHLPGDMADLHSVVLPTAASALQAVSETVIYRVPHQAVKEAATAFPSLAEAFWRDCTVDAAVLSQWAIVNSRLSARARIAHLLCELCSRTSLEECGDGTEIPWPMTQMQLADATGLTPVHVNRMLRDLRETGAIDTRDRSLKILDWRLLVKIGQFDRAYLALGNQTSSTMIGGDRS